MVVNSINFWLFFLVFLIPYFTLFRNLTKVQNTWLLIASYVFYGLADWKMLPLLAIVTGLYYVLGIVIAKNNMAKPKRASWLTTLGVVIGVGVLLYFKYFGFFITEFERLFNAIGIHANVGTFNIIMPIGISFFTFKLMSYPIEVHRENIMPSQDFVQFAAYIAFFPTILSGPIDKPNTFLPQMAKSRNFQEDDFSEGVKRVIWGMFLKMCIADRLSPWTDAILNNYSHHNATSICVAAVLYMIQMYADFSGYSDMAIGVARMMGFRVTENFNRPFFAQNTSEYWRRWHISLTSWITNYIIQKLATMGSLSGHCHQPGGDWRMARRKLDVCSIRTLSRPHTCCDYFSGKEKKENRKKTQLEEERGLQMEPETSHIHSLRNRCFAFQSRIGSRLFRYCR